MLGFNFSFCWRLCSDLTLLSVRSVMFRFNLQYTIGVQYVRIVLSLWYSIVFGLTVLESAFHKTFFRGRGVGGVTFSVW